MGRGQQRTLALLFLFTVGAVLGFMGRQGWALSFIPQYIGYLFVAMAALGTLGLNIWRGGPLDRRFDPLPAPGADSPDLSMPRDDSNPYAAPRAFGYSPPSIRVVDVPPGEAPESIRRCWVGLVLPLAPGFAGAQSHLASG